MINSVHLNNEHLLKKHGSISEQKIQISIDSRVLCRGDFFISIKGEHFNGADYALEALKKGALGVAIDSGEVEIIKSCLKTKKKDQTLVIVKDKILGKSGRNIPTMLENADSSLLCVSSTATTWQ